MKLQKHKIILLLGTFCLMASVLAQSDPYAIRYKDVVYSPFGTELTSPNSNKPSKAGAIDTSSQEATCLEIGFKKKTEPYANCVIELLGRKQLVVQENPNDPDDATCRKYGFKPKTNEYATCRQQIEQARVQAAQQQAQYQQQQRQYKDQLDEQQRQRSVAAGMALFQLGTGITSGAYNANNSYGTRPTPPSPPNPSSTYFLPGGRTMNCTTTGTVTNCF